jgi:succinate dehydrogenase/fumarate reductase cytochrome b subunit
MPEPIPADRAGAPWWLHVQRALGFGPLALYALFHLWTHWPALFGREAWLARAERYALGPGWGALVLVVFAAHAILGALRVRRGADTAVSAGGRRFQLITGVLITGFVALHLSQVWPSGDGVSAARDRSYERLWELLGQPLILGIYVLGCGALAGHLAHGLYSWLDPRLPAPLRAPFRYAAGASGFVLFVLYLQLIGRFASGEPMLPSSRPTPSHAYYAQLGPAAGTVRASEHCRHVFQPCGIHWQHAAHAGRSRQHVP